MHPLRKLHAGRGVEQVEIAILIPLAHDGETIKQRNIVLLRHHTYII